MLSFLSSILAMVRFNLRVSNSNPLKKSKHKLDQTEPRNHLNQKRSNQVVKENPKSNQMVLEILKPLNS